MKTGARGAKLHAYYALLGTLGGSLLGFLFYNYSQRDARDHYNAAEYGSCFFVAFMCTIGMEFYARAAHRDLWHGAWWGIHKTHHGEGAKGGIFEFNDVFSIANVLIFCPLMTIAYMLPPSLGSASLYGCCVGVSIYGTGYMFVHDGLHHRRFPVSLVDKSLVKYLPRLKAIADAHAKHHTKEHGAPFGLFLGPQELEAEKRGVLPPQMPMWLKGGLVCSLVLGVGGWAV